MVENASLKLYQNRPGPEQGECCLKKGEKKCLTLFWYSPTDMENMRPEKITDIGYIHNSTVYLQFSACKNCRYISRFTKTFDHLNQQLADIWFFGKIYQNENILK
jgi:hypothetical protein